MNEQEARREANATVRGLLHAAGIDNSDLEISLALLVGNAYATGMKVKPPPGHIIDDAGNVRKVLGTLPLTADGCVIGHKAWLWNIMPGAKGRDDDRPMRVCYMPAPIMDPDAYTDGPKRMYSTAEAAEAVRKEGKP